MLRDHTRLANLGEDVAFIGPRLFVPASLLAFVTGVLLVIESDGYGFGDDWIVIALVLYATTFLTGLFFLGPESGRVGRMTAEGAPEAGLRTLRLVMLFRLVLVLLFVLLYDMAVKPDFGEAGSIFWGLAGAVVAAGLVVWRYRIALAQPAGVPVEAEE
jgi:uncharacterized membrane protein